MAIEFARAEIVHAGPSSSAVGISAYVTREVRTNSVTGQAFDFREKDVDIVAKGIALPKDAPKWAREATGARIWNAAERAELLKDGSRFRVGAQLAKHITLALPAELDPADQVELLLAYIESDYTSRGILVEWAVHRPDPDSPRNAHAHLVVATRYLTEDGFGKKVREFGPRFYAGSVVEADTPGERWRLAQEAYFASRGLDISVDARAAIPRLRLPRQEMREPGVIAAENAERARMAKALVENPEVVLEMITQTRAVFTSRDVARVLAKHGVEGDVAESVRTQALGMALALGDERGVTGYYTTKAVRESERLALSLARILRRKQGRRGPSESHVAEALGRHEIDAEQREAVRTALGREQGRIGIWYGIAGAGKTRALQTARDAYEAAGWTVRAAAPTNTVARDLERAGFDASTLHRLLGEIARERTKLDARTVVMVDEAAMLSTEQFVDLLDVVERSGARVLLVGDDRQLGSIQPGGMFGVLREELGYSEFRTVRRQSESWQRDATGLLAEGRVREALELYAKAGAVVFEATTEDAVRSLVGRWKHDSDPARQAASGSGEVVRFVYARTNAEVGRLNLALAAAAREIGLVVGPEMTYAAERGLVTLAAGDRIQFRSNDHRLGLFNGNVGTVLEVSESVIRARLDGGRELAFDPREYKDFTLGYAGTVYRGQGKTQTETYVLHGAWTERSSSYVALTRHSSSVAVFVGREIAPDLETLARQMGRTVERGSSLHYRIMDANTVEMLPAKRSQVAKPETADARRRREIGGRVHEYLTSIIERHETTRATASALDERVRRWLSGRAGSAFLRDYEASEPGIVIHAVALADTRTEELLAKVPVAVIPLDRALAIAAHRVREALKATPLGPPPDEEWMWRKALERLDREIAEAQVAAEAVRRAANPLLRLVHDPAKAEQVVVDRLLAVRVDFVERRGKATSRVRDVIWKKSREYDDWKRIYDARKLCLNRIAYAFEVGLERRRVEASLVSYQLPSAGFPNIATQLEALSEQAPRTPKRERSQRRQIQRGGRDIS